MSRSLALSAILSLAALSSLSLLAAPVRSEPAQETAPVRQLKGRNVALGMEKLGRYSGTEGTYDLPVLKAGETCAIFVQSAGFGPVLGAAYCPGSI